MEKVFSINEKTGIDSRRGALGVDHPIMGDPEAPTVGQLGPALHRGRKPDSGFGCSQSCGRMGRPTLRYHASRRCIVDSFTSPGYEYFVAKELGLHPEVERTFSHGVGCTGGLAGLRTAANYACAATFLNKPARVLIVACEMGTLCARDELAVIHGTQEVTIVVQPA